MTLLESDPDRFWRRAGIIAFEDIGVADLKTVGVVTAALGGKRFRQQLGGEWAVASLIVDMMVNANKNWAADDLFAVLESWPDLAGDRKRLAPMSDCQLRKVALGTYCLIIRSLAVWYLIGTDRVSSGSMAFRRGNPAFAFTVLDELGVAPTMLEIAREGFRQCGELLSPLVALLSLENGLRDESKDDVMPPTTMIGRVPCWAFDMFTREGRSALTRLASTDASIAVWSRTYLPKAGKTEFVAQVLFRAESGQLNRRLTGILADRLKSQMDYECLGVAPELGREAVHLMREAIPVLNEIRAKVVGGQPHA